MMMNMLTGAHASLIPLITSLHNEAAATDGWHIDRIVQKIDAILDYEAEDWVKDMTVDLMIEFFDKLPDDIVTEISCDIPLTDKLPLRFCLYLMDHNHAIAGKMIEDPNILDSHDLLYRIQSGQIHEMIAAAKRHDLSLDVLNALIESREPEVYLELLQNPCVKIHQDVIQHLEESAHRSARMAWYLVSRAPEKTSYSSMSA